MIADYDVAIVGGGPAGATAGTLLAKYNPKLKILILEREQFPRDHVGESLLPLIPRILDEMGVWDKVEAANFPIKVGATYRWGATNDLWDFDFLPHGKLDPQPRPGKYEGQRQGTGFQVDRAIYDKILLDHAREMGCEVRESTAVRQILRDGDRVTGLVLDSGEQITAKHYIDASGSSGILRRAMEIPVDYPSNLRNIAIWNYWTNAEWAIEIGVGGTRIQIMALKVGWIWFIPLGPDRTSIGLVIPADYYKEKGQSTEEIYYEAVKADGIVARLTRNAEPEPNVHTTRDWSFVADRLTGENWYLIGESAGFADPILSAGMSLSMSGAREVAYAILEIERGNLDAQWLRDQYSVNHRGHIGQHIRFADFWYTAYGAFPILHDQAQRIAEDAGFKFTAKEAWQWLGQGGFIDSNGSTDIGFFGSLATKELIGSFTGDEVYHELEGKTHFKLNLDDAEKAWVADLQNGRITRHRAYKRGPKVLPLVKTIGWVVDFLRDEKSYEEIRDGVREKSASGKLSQPEYRFFWSQAVKALEVLVSYGWVTARIEPGADGFPRYAADLAATVHPNRDIALWEEAKSPP